MVLLNEWDVTAELEQGRRESGPGGSRGEPRGHALPGWGARHAAVNPRCATSGHELKVAI